MNKLGLDQILVCSLNQIEAELQVEIIGISRIRKLYGANANSFLIKTLNNKDQEQDFFIKFEEPLKISEEIEGLVKIGNFLPVPKIVVSSVSSNPSWVCSEQIEGQLFTENYLKSPRTDKINASLVEIEEEKEKFLIGMYAKTKGQISFDKYLSSKTNQLFYKRITGNRVQDFYFDKNPNNISRYFDKKIVINGKIFDKTVNEVFKEILNKYENPKINNCTSYLGHGDAHHGNILLDTNQKVWFIDAEYSDNIPANMELSKPYYNDFLGELFFHYPDEFLERFELLSTRESEEELFIDLVANKKMVNRLAITNVKIETRKEFLQAGSDFLDLKDYLFMCHTLTKNSNNYSDFLKMMFLAFSVIIMEFDPMDPESIYSFIK